MDIFGFKNQGVNYEKFRPKYPPEFYSKSVKRVKIHNKYLDIASGTGQLLFAIAPSFQKSLGIDLSENMIQSGQIKLKQLQQKGECKNVKMEVVDVMNLQQGDKFDLITIGQALHFFSNEAILTKIRNIMQPGGSFTTFGYVIKSAKSQNQKENQSFQLFYNKVKPLFTFDRDELHNHYSNKDKYPFDKVFKTTERETIEVNLEMNRQEYVSYLKTMSGYNLYLKKHQEDPIKELEANCASKVTCVFDYFRITCENE